MRKINKFNFYLKEKLFVLSCPKKIQKFKRTKWVAYLKIIKKNIKRTFFSNAFLISQNKKLKKRGVLWEKRKLFFKNKLKVRRIFYHIYDEGFAKKDFKYVYKMSKHVQSSPSEFLKQNIIKLEYNFAILLFKLNFFFSLYEARKNIENGFVLLNGKKGAFNVYLKKGDIISFAKITNSCKTIIESQFQKRVFRPFVEIDFYTNTLIITKNIEELSLEDLTLFYLETTNVSTLRLAFLRS